MAAALASRSCFCNLSTSQNASWKRNQASSRVDHHGPVTDPRTHKLASTSNRKFKNLRPVVPPDGDRELSLTWTLSALADSGRLEDALHLFDKMSHSDTFVWNVMIRAFTDNGLFKEAMDFHRRMELEGVRGDKFTYPFVLKACAGLLLLMEGQGVHGKLFKLGLHLDVYVCNSLIAMYAKLGCLEFAEKVFDEMPVRDLVSWNSMISGYLLVGDFMSSFLCFQEMLESGIEPDGFSVISVVGACSVTSCLLSGKEIHCGAIKRGLELSLKVQTSLIDMYSKCKRVDYAERLFNMICQKNVVVWNAMIGGYSFNSRALESFACLKRMQEADNSISPDAITAINILPSCAQVGTLLAGKSIHGYAIRKGFLPRLTLETALVDMYGRCRELKYAEHVFGQKTEKDLISWNAMIAAYVNNGWNTEALELFQTLICQTLQPDAITIASILPAYVELASLKEGKEMHGYVTKLELNSHIFIANSMVDFYAKRGDLQTARKYFDGMLHKNVDSWNVMIMAYGIHGFGKSSIQLYSDMREMGIEPNAKTFFALISSCKTSGMIEEGLEYLNSMTRDYGIDPGIEHYSCILDHLEKV